MRACLHVTTTETERKIATKHSTFVAVSTTIWNLLFCRFIRQNTCEQQNDYVNKSDWKPVHLLLLYKISVSFACVFFSRKNFHHDAHKQSFQFGNFVRLSFLSIRFVNYIREFNELSSNEWPYFMKLFNCFQPAHHFVQLLFAQLWKLWHKNFVILQFFLHFILFLFSYLAQCIPIDKCTSRKFNKCANYSRHCLIRITLSFPLAFIQSTFSSVVRAFFSDLYTG